MIPKRPPKVTWFYRSKDYKAELRLKFYKWSHMKAAKVFYGKFTTEHNPYALDWMGRERTKVMQCRANAMFDTMYTMLQIRVEQVPEKTKKKAIHKALQTWAQRQQEIDGRQYKVTNNTIIAD